jgi:hypothetical protein
MTDEASKHDAEETRADEAIADLEAPTAVFLARWAGCCRRGRGFECESLLLVAADALLRVRRTNGGRRAEEAES